MKSLLIVSDPIPDGHSVQFDTVKSLASSLNSRYRITIASTRIPSSKVSELESAGYIVLYPRNQKYRMYCLLKRLKRDNESMVWLEAWIREFFLGSNMNEVSSMMDEINPNYVLNLSYPTPVKADIWWNQGPPMYETLKEMSRTNSLARAVSSLARPLIKIIDMKLLRKTYSLSKNSVTSSRYIAGMYEKINLPSNCVVYSCSQMHRFYRSTDTPSRDYVLIYISKETDFSPIESMYNAGIRMIGFGSKIPIGTDIQRIRKMVNFKGYVTFDELRELYSNALFTAFPFTTEGLGCVPLESMACGTPVLTYNKQGPAETVLNEKTGWLVDDPKSFSDKAIKLWKEGESGIDAQTCIGHASEFTVDKQTVKIAQILDGSVIS